MSEKDTKKHWVGWVIVSKENPWLRVSIAYFTRADAKAAQTLKGTKIVKVKIYPPKTDDHE